MTYLVFETVSSRKKSLSVPFHYHSLVKHVPGNSRILPLDNKVNYAVHSMVQISQLLNRYSRLSKVYSQKQLYNISKLILGDTNMMDAFLPYQLPRYWPETVSRR